LTTTTAVAYLVRGENPILRGEVVEELVTELVAGDDRMLAVEEVVVPGKATAGEGADETPAGAEGRAAAMATALNAAQSPPFMTARRVVVVNDAGNLAKDDVLGIVEYLDNPLPTTALVVVAGGGRVPKDLLDALKRVKAVELGPKAEKTGDVLDQHLREAELTLQPDAKKAIAAHLGEDAGRIPQLVELLVSTFGPGTALEAGDVDPYLADAGAVPGYTLTNDIEAGDVPAALETLHRMLSAADVRQQRPMHPLQVIGMLHGYFARIARLTDPDIRSSSDAVEALGGKIKEYPARKALAQARALGSEGVREAFDYLFAADLDLKGARAIPEDAVMEVLVARLASLSARAGRKGSRPRSRR
jgi:DNA polymerase-3 subunit delta